MKLIIAGTRDFDDYEKMRKEVDAFLKKHQVDAPEIVSGGAKGADALGERYAREKGYAINRFPAKWNLFGKAAGPIRNEKMARYADACIVFWDGESRGTRSMIALSKEYELELSVVLY